MCIPGSIARRWHVELQRGESHANGSSMSVAANASRTHFFERYFLSAFIFKSVLIGGGYTTGRELVQFFLARGPATGFWGVVVASCIFSAVLAVVFELARRYELHDYRTFLKKLLGPAWVLYEIAFLCLLVLILSVLGAASGEIVAQRFAVPQFVGTAVQMACVATIVFFGTQAIERFFTAWAVVLYGAFAIFFVWVATVLGPDIETHWRASRVTSAALSSGLLYAGYSMAVVPTILYCARHFTGPRDAIVSGLLAGPVAMIPAFLFFVAMVARYPEVNQVHIPIVYMLAQLDAPAFGAVFQVVIFGTLVEAGAALIHGFNQRIDDMAREKQTRLPRGWRAWVALALMCVSVVLANEVGIVDLIAKGYGYSTYVFLALIAAPTLTRGVWLITRPTTPSPTVRWPS
jgi:uncharacterized membrane protein YkvI